MDVKRIYRESFPAVRLIGRRYSGEENFRVLREEWYRGGLFAPLEALPQLKGHDSGLIGAKRIAENGGLEYWIGLFLPAGTQVPEGYDFVDIEAMDYAVFWLHGDDQSGELFGLETHNRCLEQFPANHFVRREDDWCFERYNCPRFTEPDAEGRVILDYGISIL